MADAATTLPAARRRPARRERPRSIVADGPPPHDLEMEESLLGAMLLSGDAVAAALELVLPGDFYGPAHGLIYGAIASLAARSHPVDPVTVADELRRTGLIEEIGEPGILVALQGNTPSVANTRYYAERIAGLATERRLLGHTAELANAIRLGDGERRARAVEAIAGTTADAAGIAGTLVREDVAALIRDPQPAVEPELLERLDGKCLLLRAAVTILHAEPSTGKSWLAVEAVRQVTTAGERACVLDYEGNGRTWAERLAALGMPAPAADRLDYIRPGSVPAAVVARAAVATEPDLVVIDGLAAAMAQAGLDEDRAGECLAWMRSVARTIALGGAAVLIIDHVVKDKDARGRWGRGSGAKLGEVDTAFSMEVVEPYARGKAGSARLRVAKDRHGAIGPERSTAAMVHFLPGVDGERLTIELQPAGDGEDGEWHGPTNAMASIVDVLRATGREMSCNQLAAALRATGQGFKRQTVSQAAEALALDPTQPVIVRAGGNRARYFRFDPATQALNDHMDEEF